MIASTSKPKCDAKKRNKKRPSAKELKDLIEQANGFHREVINCLRSTILYARNAGQCLVKAKARLEHGKFGRWLIFNFHGSYETAAVYMRIHRSWSKIEPLLAKNLDLTLEQALHHLRCKRPSKRIEMADSELRRNELKETFMVNLEKWTDKEIAYLLEKQDPLSLNRLDACLETLRNEANQENGKER